MQKENFKKLDQYIRQNELFNGNILIAKGQDILYLGSFGSTHNPKKEESILPETIFELASVSKQFTAYATLVAFENAGLGIDEDIRKFIPNFPYRNITTRNLLNHTSGLPDYFVILDKLWDKTKIACNKDVLDFLIKTEPKAHFLPNENWEYSNTGYVLLAILIENVSGMLFKEFLKTEIFVPLNMTSSFIYNRRLSHLEIPNYAYGTIYNEANKKYELPDLIPEYNAVYYMDGIQGDGTVNSNVLDLLKWNNEILNGSNLRKGLVELMLTNTPEIKLQKIEYGMGWIINEDSQLGLIAYHGGSWPGYSTYNSIYKNDGFSIISLCNKPKNLEVEQKIIMAAENILYNKPYEFWKE